MLLMSPDYSLTEELVEVWTNRLIFSTGGFHLFAGGNVNKKNIASLLTVQRLLSININPLVRRIQPFWPRF